MEKSPHTVARASHIVLNAVTEDSRVLKRAWSLSNAGWNTLLVGAAAGRADDEFTIGGARVIRLNLKPVINNALLARILRRCLGYVRRIESSVLFDGRLIISSV